MIQIMHDDTLRHEMGQNARKVVERYSEEIIMKKWVSLFKGLKVKG